MFEYSDLRANYPTHGMLTLSKIYAVKTGRPLLFFSKRVIGDQSAGKQNGHHLKRTSLRCKDSQNNYHIDQEQRIKNSSRDIEYGIQKTAKQ
jgi:hypothetical protein